MPNRYVVCGTDPNILLNITTNVCEARVQDTTDDIAQNVNITGLPSDNDPQYTDVVLPGQHESGGAGDGTPVACDCNHGTRTGNVTLGCSCICSDGCVVPAAFECHNFVKSTRLR